MQWLSSFRKVLILSLLISSNVLIAQNAELPLDYTSNVIDSAITLFEQRRYDEARGAFSVISSNAELSAYHPEVFYWLAQIDIAQGNFAAAQQQFFKIYNQFPQSTRYVGARYHHSRLHFYTGNYHAAVAELESFRESFPDSDFVGNSYYWSGLSLLTLGKNAEAKAMFEQVVRGYPTSYRVDAAHYQLSLLRLAQREDNLLEVVRWTHEEYLSLIDEVERSVDETDQILITTVPQEELEQEEQEEVDRQLLDEYRRQIERLRVELDNLRRIEVSKLRRGEVPTTLLVEERSQALLKLREEFQRTREEILERLGEQSDQ